MLVPDPRHLVDAQGVDPRDAAPLTDGGLTSFHAITTASVSLNNESTAVVIGVGGLGHLAVQLLRHLTGAKVVASDTKPEALELARRRGAHSAVLPADLAAAVGDADLVLDFVGNQGTIELGASLVAAAGELSVVGSGGGHLDVAKGRALPQGLRMSLPFWGSRNELEQLMELARGGHVSPERTVIGFDDVAGAYESVRKGEALGRYVVDLTA